jgi:cytoskeletal protein CcmA (bactofilin family)
LSTRAPGARVPGKTADQPPHETAAAGQRGGVTLGPRDRLIGELHIDGDVRLGGTVQGEIHATGDVEVDGEAKVNASLAGGDVNIRGIVSGPVTARKRLVVARSGSLTGDVRVARLVIQDGATFSGNVSMGPQPETFAAASEPEVAATAPKAGTAASGSETNVHPVGQAKPAAGKSKGKPKR